MNPSKPATRGNIAETRKVTIKEEMRDAKIYVQRELDINAGQRIDITINPKGEVVPELSVGHGRADLVLVLPHESVFGLELGLDTQGDTSINVNNGITVADLVLIPSKPTAPDLTALGRTFSMVKNLEKSYVFVVTQTIARTKLALKGAAVLSEFGMVAPSTISNRISYANAMNIDSSAAVDDKQAAEELSEVWNFISSKLFDLEKKDAK
ncbi:plasmid partitioning-family protein [Trichonephila inaurata madagascariensis]|uniref:Plasmid partitioning-family protein n=1 Tax=Trichonephila inaurata madagascariensis TaxID=2747483 RepID=A0A8X7CRS0_9ARAC|nr:plasmid partitioning-family protein [Trichonephila inaurata madagascariensis]